MNPDDLAHNPAHSASPVTPASTKTEMTWIVMRPENDR